ncbi:MAG: thiol peroxidase [Propionibacteriaceae bacterium]|jgi:thiol peroxidase|nr:thiol peroxidase [Propionibacteriaceae bacterium]
MGTTLFSDLVVNTSGELPAVGSQLPEFTVTKNDLSDFTSADLAGKRAVISIFPSVDTGICSTSVRKFNERAASLANTVVLCVSNDLPFALGRFCGAEGIENVVTASSFRENFGRDFGVLMEDGPLRGLLARAVVVADETGKVLYTEMVKPLNESEPNYDAAIAALS